MRSESESSCDFVTNKSKFHFPRGRFTCTMRRRSNAPKESAPDSDISDLSYQVHDSWKRHLHGGFQHPLLGPGTYARRKSRLITSKWNLLEGRRIQLGANGICSKMAIRFRSVF